MDCLTCDGQKKPRESGGLVFSKKRENPKVQAFSREEKRRSLRTEPKAAAAPRMGRGPGVAEGVALWVTELSNAVKALLVTLKVLVNADDVVPAVKVEGVPTVENALTAPLGLGLGAELVAVTVDENWLPMMDDPPVAAH